MSKPERIDELARELPWRELTPDEVERVRARLRAEVMAEPQWAPARARRKVWIAAAAAAAVAVAAAAAVAPAVFRRSERAADHVPARPPVAQAQAQAAAATVIVEGEAASFAHDVAAGEELIRLHHGRVRVRTPEGRPVRVIIGDAEIRLSADELEVIADDDRLSAVWAKTGTAELLKLGAAPIVLRPGDRWVAPPPLEVRPVVRAPVKRASRAAPVPVEPVDPNVKTETSTAPEVIEEKEPASEPKRGPEVKREPEVKTAPPEAPVLQTRDEKTFRAGWALYRAEAWVEAAETLAGVDPSGPWSEDASWWRAQALVRARVEHEAAAAFRELLRRHPRSRHAGEARVTLAWILLRLDRRQEAQGLFEEAASDPSPEVRESAKRGLKALAD